MIKRMFLLCTTLGFLPLMAIPNSPIPNNALHVVHTGPPGATGATGPVPTDGPKCLTYRRRPNRANRGAELPEGPTGAQGSPGSTGSTGPQGLKALKVRGGQQDPPERPACSWEIMRQAAIRAVHRPSPPTRQCHSPASRLPAG